MNQKSYNGWILSGLVCGYIAFWSFIIDEANLPECRTSRKITRAVVRDGRPRNAVSSPIPLQSNQCIYAPKQEDCLNNNSSVDLKQRICPDQVSGFRPCRGKVTGVIGTGAL